MKKRILVTAVALALGAPLATQAAETPAHTVTGNFGIFSNYIFRGVSQTSEKAALQGGFDYAHKSGVYAGVWGSNVSWLSDFSSYSESSLEMDVYAGYKGTIGGGFGYDVGGIYYYYPGKRNGNNSANTTEVYGAVSWEWLTAKLSYVVGDYFTVDDASGSIYADLTASYPIGKTGLTVIGHVGYLKVAGNGTSVPGTCVGCNNDDAFGYTDWKVGVTYALPKDFVVGVAYATTNARNDGYSPTGEKWEENQVVVHIQKTF